MVQTNLLRCGESVPGKTIEVTLVLSARVGRVFRRRGDRTRQQQYCLPGQSSLPFVPG